MSELKKEDYTKIKGEVGNVLEKAIHVVKGLDELFGPGTRVIERSKGPSWYCNRLVLFEGQDYRITIDRVIK